MSLRIQSPPQSVYDSRNCLLLHLWSLSGLSLRSWLAFLFCLCSTNLAKSPAVKIASQLSFESIPKPQQVNRAPWATNPPRAKLVPTATSVLEQLQVEHDYAGSECPELQGVATADFATRK